MYFRALTGGIARLPQADPSIRARIDQDAEKAGWPALHQQLAEVDPEAASRIKPNDKQRIQRALEVFLSSGKSLSDWQKEGRAKAGDDIRFFKIALQTASRQILHERIAQRLNWMLNNGFLSEVEVLRERPGLTREHPSMRAVGYRQVWEYLCGESTLEEAGTKALYATRQLAKRQITWLRSESGVRSFDPLEASTIDAISTSLIEFLNA